MRISSGALAGLLFALVLCACGGGNSGGAPSNSSSSSNGSNCSGGPSLGTGSSGSSAPSLTLDDLSPTGTYFGTFPVPAPVGGVTPPPVGTTQFAGTVTIATASANGFKFALRDSCGIAVFQNAAAIAGGPSQGVQSFSVNVPTSTLPVGTYEFEVQATAASGGTSNIVGQAFTVIAYPWTSASPMPVALTDFGIAEVGGKIYILTGLSTVNGVGTATNLVQIYDPQTDSWSAGPPAPTARAGAMAANVGGSIYLIGGFNSANPTGMGSVDVLDPETGTWSTAPADPTPKFFSGVCIVGTDIFTLGGTQSQTDVPTLNLLEQLDASSGTWSTLAPNVSYYPLGAHIGCAVVNGILYTAGGNTGADGSDESIGAWSYDPATNDWATLAFFGYNRTRHAEVAVGGNVYIMGGLSDAGGISAPTYVTEMYTPSTNSWVIKAPMPVATQDVSAAQINGVVYVFSPESTYVYQALDDTLTF